MSQRLARIAARTVEILHSGEYEARTGTRVVIAEQIARAVAGTRLYLPDDALPVVVPPAPGPIEVEVTDESTLEAGRRLGEGVAALVFASARNPGGGFLTGAKAQEEDVARASALYRCLTAVPEFYAHHRAERDLRYTDRVIYSPEVPVFRSPDNDLLEQPYRLSFLTAAAPNLGALLDRQPELAGTVPAVLEARAERVLRVAAAHGHRRIVLGAWGCGVFRNSPEVVAAAFRTGLARVPYFEHVTFAILDRTGATLRAFQETFAAP